MASSRWLLSLLLLSACRSYEIEPTAQTQQAITGACSAGTVGLPCDPDGSGPLKECEWICAVRGTSSSGLTIACVKLSDVGLTNNDGKICGAGGPGDCGSHCVGSTCDGTRAPDGVACRPPSIIGGVDICDGQCKSGVCVALGSEKCADNKIGDCTYDFCNAKKSTECIKYPLPKGYACNDMMSCTTGDVCDGAGTCTGTAKVCPMTSASCRVNVCDPTTAGGTCVERNAPPGTACAFDRCFAGSCDASGACIKGAAVNCDDMDACTTDSCEAATGCVHTAIAGCGDAGADGAVDSGADSGIADSGIADSGIADSGVVDTGTVIDTGTGSIDTGVVTTDTGIKVDSSEGDSATIDDASTEDTTTTDSSVSSDGALTDTGTDLGIETTVEADTGCGCRTASSRTSYAGISLAALALVAARRRRGLR